MNNRRRIRRVAIVAVILISALALRLTAFRPKLVPVTIFKVAPGRVEETVTNSKAGTVQSRHRASLSPEVGGRVAKLGVRAGDRVRAGAVLLTIDESDYRAQVQLQERFHEAARSSQAEACLAADHASTDLKRTQEMFGQGIVSQSAMDLARTQYDQARAACEAAAARVRQAAEAVDIAKLNLRKTSILAPFDGVVAELKAEVGEWITPSPPGLPMPSVIDLIDPDSIYVSAALDETDVARVALGNSVRITTDSRPGESFAGRITRVAPYVLDIQQQNRTFEVEVDFDDSKVARSFLPGTSADVEVILRAKESVLRIPSYALMEGGRVLVLRDGRLVAIPVGIGLKNWGFTEVTSGLATGDPVVVSIDRTEVREGLEARVEAETLK